VGAHISIPGVHLLRNGFQCSKAFVLLFPLHQVGHILLQPPQVILVKGGLQDVVLALPILQPNSTVTLVGVGGEVCDRLLDGVLHLQLLLSVRQWHLVIQFHSALLQNFSVDSTVAKIEVDSRLILHNSGLSSCTGPALGGVRLGADELARVAEAGAPVGQVERRRVAIVSSAGVAGFLLNFL